MLKKITRVNLSSAKRTMRGDTIIEVLVSMAVLAVVAAAAYATSTRSFHASLNSQYRDQGLSYAQQQIELLKNIDNGAAPITNYTSQTSPFCIDSTTMSITSASTGCPMSGGGSNSDFKVSDTYNNTTKTFTVRVAWTSADGKAQQATVYYKPSNSYVDCPGGTVVINGTSYTCGSAPTTSDTTSPPTAILSISAVPHPPYTSPIPYNGTADITWNTQYITSGSCTALGDWSGAKADSGTFTTGPLTNNPTSTFTLSCKDLTGTTRTASASVAVSAAPPVTFNQFNTAANPIAYNGSTTIYWNTTNATSCTGGGFSTGGATSNTSPGVGTGTLTNSITYTLTCTNIAGTSYSASYTLTVNPPPNPSLTFTADSTSLSYGGSTTLRWSSTNVPSGNCTASGSWSGTVASSGATGTGSLTSGKSYTLTCVGYPGTTQAQKTVNISVAPAPPSMNYFYPSPNPICYGCGTTLYWSSNNTTSCTWGGPVGNVGTGALYGNTGYTVTCSGPGGSTSASTTVSVNPPPPPPPPPCSAWASGSIVDYWSTYISGGGSNCQYYYDSVVGWNGGGTWGPTSRPVCHTQQGGADPWGWLSSGSWCSG